MRKKTATGALPAGFIDTSGGGDFPPAWEPKPGEILMGLVHSVRQESAQRLKRQNAKKGDTVCVVVVADSDGVLQTVFESKALESFCEKVKPGDSIFLQYVETRKIGKKQFKVFKSGIKPRGKRGK